MKVFLPLLNGNGNGYDDIDDDDDESIMFIA